MHFDAPDPQDRPAPDFRAGGLLRPRLWYGPKSVELGTGRVEQAVRWRWQAERNGAEEQFNAIKYELYPWLKDIHRDAHAQLFIHLDKAWTTFFSDLEAGKQAHEPRFKKRKKDAAWTASTLPMTSSHWTESPAGSRRSGLWP